MAKRGRPASWLGAENLTSELVNEFNSRLDEIEVKEMDPARDSKHDLKIEADSRKFPWKPFMTARAIMAVSHDPDAVAAFIDQLNFCLDALGLERRQGHLEHGNEVSVKAPSKKDSKLSAVA